MRLTDPQMLLVIMLLFRKEQLFEATEALGWL